MHFDIYYDLKQHISLMEKNKKTLTQEQSIKLNKMKDQYVKNMILMNKIGAVIK